jgi:protein-tyrosine phosphatase
LNHAALAHPGGIRHPRPGSRAIVAGGALLQLTAAAIDGRLGGSTQRCARTLLERRLAHLIASDAHAPSVRAIGMADAVRAVGDAALARWLTVDVPRAILDGHVVPTFPESRKRRRRFRRGRG